MKARISLDLVGVGEIELEPRQRTVLTQMLAQGPDGRWATSVFWTGTDRAVRDYRALLGAFAFDENVLYSFSSAVTARDAFRRLRRLIEDSPELRRHVRRFSAVNGAQGIELHNGRRIAFLIRSRAGGRGLSVDCVIADEHLNDEHRAEAALNLAASARPQLVG